MWSCNSVLNVFLCLCFAFVAVGASSGEPQLGSARVVFQIDKGFVAQVADVVGGRSAPMNEEQRIEAEKTVVGEFSKVKHVRGILSMGRYSDPDSGSSSFSMLLGDAPHLDGEYAIFGKVTKGDDTLKKLEQLPTRREGIFVMPKDRITILSSYYYDTEMESCEHDRSSLKRRLAASFVEIERQRMKCFP
ncbi:peptidyl-prolyl cis-trans isomerase CYP23 isoform X2 [Ziziphus jujuba]|uniref:Peptidyl-prolyl cis-trans isomerase CYP23 isoform X2 n=1 Tax=Ziziphus jujuba TaxID=326968 RepID=A0ABM3I2H3_ZIZJJ|nr:peptidyl-prolyl cis-trans isomerase CYP23 isoform X2 [Ziziphus jujuba]